MGKVSKNQMPFLFIFYEDIELTIVENFLILLINGHNMWEKFIQKPKILRFWEGNEVNGQ